MINKTINITFLTLLISLSFFYTSVFAYTINTCVNGSCVTIEIPQNLIDSNSKTEVTKKVYEEIIKSGISTDKVASRGPSELADVIVDNIFKSKYNKVDGEYFSILCSSSGQLCDKSFTKILTSQSKVTVNLQTPASHCSKVRFITKLNNTTVNTSSFLAPLEETQTIDLGSVKNGDVLSIGAEGEVGGCNSGTLVSWGATMYIPSRATTTVDNVCSKENLITTNNGCVCANGATDNPTCKQCPVNSTMQNGQCICDNNGDIFQQCNVCKERQIFNSTGKCADTCSKTNVCGQNISGFMENGTCTLPSNTDPNESCIVSFNVTTNTVNPNGSVEFSWALPTLPSNIRANCGFVDLTTATPRPIPGLQNLDSDQDRVRINNIQSTTRFCLVCQFVNLLTNTTIGEASRHQWVRVLRVGEN